MEAKQVKMEELERIQSTIEHETEVFSTNVVARQVEIEVALIHKNLDPIEKEALEEAMVQSVIEAFLNKSEDNIVEIDLGSNLSDQGQCLMLMKDKFMISCLK